MVITWYGQSCFRIQNPHINLLIDPFGSGHGIPAPRGGARIVVMSEGAPPKVKGEDVFCITGPGEYERENVFIQGITPTGNSERDENRSTLYTVLVEGIRIAHLNLRSEATLSDKDIEQLGEVDILMLPVGDKKTYLPGAGAASITRSVGPKIVIPMSYAIPKLKVKLDKVEPFLKAIGVGKVDPIPKLVIKKKDLSEEEMKVVVLSKS